MQRSFGEFQLLEVIGQGSSSTVYRAQAPTAEFVALKVAKASLEPRALERFLREGQLTARLSDPGIVAVRSSGEVGGVPYVACELVEGARPLDEAWSEWSLERRVRAVRDAARAVGVAHGEGLVHRDLKPANVLVDAEGVVRVTDFGLSWHPDVETLTQSRAALGTPLYMAPEVWSAPGKAPRRSPAVDVWSLGILLYEALARRHPYGKGEQTVLGILRILRRPLTPPEALAPGVPQALSAVCLRALSKDPASRFPDAAALAEAIDARRASGSVSPWLPLTALLFAVLLALVLAVLSAGPEVPTPVATPPTPVVTDPQPADPAAPEPAPANPEPPTPTPPPAGTSRQSTDELLLAVRRPRGELRAEPERVPTAANQGSTTLSWETKYCEQRPTVWLYGGPNNDAEGKLFSANHRARETVTWIRGEHVYVFRLYAGPDATYPLLDEVVVRGVPARSGR